MFFEDMLEDNADVQPGQPIFAVWHQKHPAKAQA